LPTKRSARKNLKNFFFKFFITVLKIIKNYNVLYLAFFQYLLQGKALTSMTRSSEVFFEALRVRRKKEEVSGIFLFLLLFGSLRWKHPLTIGLGFSVLPNILETSTYKKIAQMKIQWFFLCSNNLYKYNFEKFVV